MLMLIGNATVSAAMVNAIDFRNRCRAVLVRDPAGERPSSYAERRAAQAPSAAPRVL